MDANKFKDYLNGLLTVTVETDTSSLNKNIAFAGIIGIFIVTIFLLGK